MEEMGQMKPTVSIYPSPRMLMRMHNLVQFHRTWLRSWLKTEMVHMNEFLCFRFRFRLRPKPEVPVLLCSLPWWNYLDGSHGNSCFEFCECLGRALASFLHSFSKGYMKLSFKNEKEIIASQNSLRQQHIKQCTIHENKRYKWPTIIFIQSY